MPHSGERIVVIDENPARAAILEQGLREAGYTDVTLIAKMTGLIRTLERLDPDIILIDLENPSRDTLEQMFQVSRNARRPVAMFVDQSDASMIEAAVDASVSAYIVNGLSKERVKPIMDMTISRFNAFSRLQNELENVKGELADRKIIDRAKGILIQQGMAEDEAYKRLRSTAMSQNRKLVDIAQSVVTAAQVLQSGGLGRRPGTDRGEA